MKVILINPVRFFPACLPVVESEHNSRHGIISYIQVFFWKDEENLRTSG
jgi:hypothetical protein